MAKPKQIGAGRDPFWWLRDRDALLKRFIMAQALGPPRCRERSQPGPGRPGRAPAAAGGRRAPEDG